MLLAYCKRYDVRNVSEEKTFNQSSLCIITSIKKKQKKNMKNSFLLQIECLQLYVWSIKTISNPCQICLTFQKCIIQSPNVEILYIY